MTLCTLPKKASEALPSWLNLFSYLEGKGIPCMNHKQCEYQRGQLHALQLRCWRYSQRPKLVTACDVG